MRPAILQTPAAIDRELGRRLTAAHRRARRRGRPVLASATVSLPADSDPTALAVAARVAGEPWFCLEQPDRDRSAIAALGVLVELTADGAGRFSSLARRWREIVAEAEPVDGPPGSGLIALGGFAHADDGGSSPRWDGFPAASLHVPELSIARQGEDTRVTVNVLVAPDDTLEDLQARVGQRLQSLRPAPLPMLDPAPTGQYRVTSPMPPSHYEEAVRRGVERIRAGELEKLVLAREVQVEAPRDHDAAAVIGVLRDAYSSCYVFAVGRGDSTFIAASPELLIRRQGQRASTVALAGSTRRSADPAVDDHLGEQLRLNEKEDR